MAKVYATGGGGAIKVHAPMRTSATLHSTLSTGIRLIGNERSLDEEMRLLRTRHPDITAILARAEYGLSPAEQRRLLEINLRQRIHEGKRFLISSVIPLTTGTKNHAWFFQDVGDEASPIRTAAQAHGDDDDPDAPGQVSSCCTAINPNGWRKICWDVVIVLFIVYYVVLAPYEFAFGQSTSNLAAAFDYIGDTLFIVDMLVSYRTGFVVTRMEDRREIGTIVTDQSEIRRSYFSGPPSFFGVGLFWIDLFSLGVPYWRDPLEKKKSLRVIRVLKVLRLIRLHRFKDKVYAFDRRTSVLATQILRLVVLMLVLLGLSHFLGCGFFFIASLDSDDPTWVDRGGIDPTDMDVMYLQSVSWAWHALISGGYADVTPGTINEYVFGNATLVLGAIFFAAWLGSVTSLIQTVMTQDEPLVRREMIIEKFIKRYGLGEDIGRRLGELTNYQWELNHGFEKTERQVLDSLPPSTREHIVWHIHQELLQGVDVFRNAGISDSFLRQIAMRLKQQLCLPGDEIISIGDIGRHMYFLRRGETEVLDADSGKPVVLLRDGAHFGELAIFLEEGGFMRSNTVRARTRCEIFSLSREDLAALLDDFPAELLLINEWAVKRREEIVKRGAQKMHHTMAKQNAFTLHCTVVEAKDLSLTGCRGGITFPSPYAVIRWCGDSGGVLEERKTVACKRTAQPEWRQHVHFALASDNPDRGFVQLEIRSKARHGRDAFLGNAQFHVQCISEEGGLSGWFKLKAITGLGAENAFFLPSETYREPETFYGSRQVKRRLVCDICELDECLKRGRCTTGASIRASMFVKEAFIGVTRERRATLPKRFSFGPHSASVEGGDNPLAHLARMSTSGSLSSRRSIGSAASDSVRSVTSSRPAGLSRRTNSWHEETSARQVAVNLGCPSKVIDGVTVPWDEERDCEMSLSDIVRHFSSRPSAVKNETVFEE